MDHLYLSMIRFTSESGSFGSEFLVLLEGGLLLLSSLPEFNLYKTNIVPAATPRYKTEVMTDLRKLNAIKPPKTPIPILVACFLLLSSEPTTKSATPSSYLSTIFIAPLILSYISSALTMLDFRDTIWRCLIN